MNRISFIRHCIKSIKTTGTIARSSKHLCKKMIDEIDFDNTKQIVELGAGDGVITKHILKNMRPDAILLTFEINKKFCNLLNQIEDDRLVVINDSAENMDKYVQEYNLSEIEAMVSAIPFVVLPKELSKNIISICHDVLNEGGVFIQMHYSLILKKMYSQIFRTVHIKFVLLNLPPAYVLSMTK